MADQNTTIYNIDGRVGRQTNYAWWKSKPDELYQDVFSIVETITEDQDYRRYNNLKYAALYANYQMLGFYGTQFMTAQNLPTTRLTLNVVKSCIDTAASKISKAKPRPLFLTDGGVYSQKKKAEQLTQYIEGAFEDIDMYEKGQTAFLHGCVTGTGFIKFYKDYDAGKVCAEHVLTDEIVIDDNEALYGNPRQLHQKRYLHKDVLKEMFPEKKEYIDMCNTGVEGDYTSKTVDLCLVVESWHLKSGKDAKDGKHTICIENCTLLEEEYTKDYFPFVWFKWSPRLVGFFGSGLAEELVGIQLEINKILKNIQIAQKLMSVPRIFIEDGSAVNQMGITNDFAAIYKYKGTPPRAETFSAMSSEIYNYLWQLYQKAYEITGISMLSASSKKPSGLDSGVAIREYQDIETERFVLVGQRYEKMFIDAANIIVDMSKDLFEEKKGLKVKVKQGKFIKEIKWKDIDLAEDQYILKVYPTNMLPSTPSGKLQMVQELVQAGFLDKEQALNLLDYPDIEAFFNLTTASIDNINYYIELMIDDGKYESPEPFMDLQRAITMVQSAYLRAKADKVADERLDLLRRFITDCQNMLSLANPPTTPQTPQVEGAQPTAVPEPPDVSELLPNVPQS